MKRGLFAASILFFLIASSAHAQGAPGMQVQPKTIEMGALFDGTTITATGEIPGDGEAVLRFLGEGCDLHMKERGKLFGVMWMNLDSLIFRGVPSVCIVTSSGDLDKIAGKPEEGDTVDSLRLSGIKKEMRLESGGGNHEGAFDELLKLKADEGLYRELTGNVSYGPASGGVKSFRARIPVPARLTPGQYMVELSVVRDGRIVSRATEPVSADLVGFPKMLAGLAFGHSALYGIFSAVIAILAGLAIGIVFQGKAAH